MGYTKNVWLNYGEAGAIPIDKTNLNEIEAGIYNAYPKLITGTLSYTNTDWTADTSNYALPFKYVQEISTTGTIGITVNTYCIVLFSPADAESGKLAPVCQSVSNGFKIYSSDNTISGTIAGVLIIDKR